jgi:hypothetical protein
LANLLKAVEKLVMEVEYATENQQQSWAARFVSFPKS